jgi:Na+/H+ antiporter NhaD/arsenite permease-like protein
LKQLALSQLIAIVALGGPISASPSARLPLFRVDRTGVAIIGAVVIAGGVIPWDEAVGSVDVPTLALLFGMMIAAAYLRLSGFFVLVTVEPDDRSRVHYALMAKTSLVVSAMLVAFIAGVPIVLVALAGAAWTLRTRRVKPDEVDRAVLVLRPVIADFADPGRGWLIVAMASPFAGNLTLVGSVAHLIVGWFALSLLPSP